MAIKTISKLDPYQNEVGERCIGGSFHLYESNNSNDENPATEDPQGKSYQAPFRFDESTDYNLLFEVSKPAIKTGAEGLTDEEFQSYKLTYKDLIKNIILDTKTYLNARNNLGDFDLCCLVNKDYTFAGDKTFKDDVNIKSDLGVIGNTNLDGRLTVKGAGSFGSTLYVANNLTCNKNIYGKGDLSATGSLYTATLSSSSLGTTVKPTFTVLNVLTAATSQVTVAQALKVDNNLSANSGYFNSVKTGTLTTTGDASVGGKLTVINSGTFGSLTCYGNCELTANHAKWSDLAEYYKADAQYEPGTLVKFGGINEVTIADDEANGIVTSKPAFLMNCGMKEDPLGCAIALAGRVPVKVVGKVKKFDKIVLSEKNGIAKAIDPKDGTYKNFKILGRALEASNIEEVKLVECVVKFEL